MKEVYLYFRTIAALGDDDSSADSAMFPLSRLQGMVPSADDTLNIYFKPMINQENNRFDHDADSTAGVNSDYVVCQIGTNDHKTLWLHYQDYLLVLLMVVYTTMAQL